MGFNLTPGKQIIIILANSNTDFYPFLIQY